MPDIRDLMREALIRGFQPNPWLWDAMLRRGGISAFNAAPNVPMETPGALPVVGASPISTLQRFGGAALPLLRQGVGDFSTGSSSLDGLISQASGLLSGVGGIYNLGQGLATGNVNNIASGALSTGALGARLLGNTGLLGGAGSAVNAISPYLGGLGTLYSLGTGIAQGNIPQAIIGAIPGILGTTGSALSGLGAAQAATIPLAAEGGLGGAAGAGLSGAGAGLSELAGPAGLYVAAILAAMQDQANAPIESRRNETLGIQRNFPGAWASLTSAPGAAEAVAQYNRVPGGGGVDIETAIKNAQDALYRGQDVASYIGTEGGRSLESKPLDVSQFAQAAPRLSADAMLAILGGVQGLNRNGGTTPANTNVWGGPYYNQFQGPYGDLLNLEGSIRPGFNPNQALWALASQAGIPSVLRNPAGSAQDTYYPGLQNPGDPQGHYEQVGPERIPNYYGSAGGPDVTPSFAGEQTWIPQFNEGVEQQLAGVNPSNQMDVLLGILKGANPNFDQSILGSESNRLSNTAFPGTSASGASALGGGTGLPGAPFLPSAGQLSSKQQISSEPGALANPLNTNESDTLSRTLEASKAFLGSA